jgi:hypothetical protein
MEGPGVATVDATGTPELEIEADIGASFPGSDEVGGEAVTWLGVLIPAGIETGGAGSSDIFGIGGSTGAVIAALQAGQNVACPARSSAMDTR